MEHRFASMLPGAAALVALCLAASAHAFEPTSSYDARKVQGFTVLVNCEVFGHEREAAEALRELEAQLKNVAATVPEGPLAALREVHIWLEWEAKPKGAAEFHHSAGWLKDNGYNPEKRNAVEINNARNMVRWSRREQPWMVLHELAHAYHFTVLGEGHSGLAAAYAQAMERKLYVAVLHVGGKTRRAYATTDAAEYFAELSEAYFGTNDFFPFNRADLAKHDPVGFRLMQDAWGKPRH